jgi:hypothetical protein
MGDIEGVRSTTAGRVALAGRTRRWMGCQFGKKVRIVGRPFAKHNYCLLGCGVFLEYLSAN